MTALSGILLFAPRRAERGFFAMFAGAVGAITVLPASVLARGDAFAGGAGDVAADAAMMAVWAGVTAMIARQYVLGIRIRRLMAIVDRASGLLGSLEHRTAAGGLAVLQEVLNCYAEGERYLAGINDRRIVRSMRAFRLRIECLYSMKSDRVKNTRESAAEYARTMELLGRARDGAQRPLGR